MSKPISKKKLPKPLSKIESGPYEKHIPLPKQKKNKIKMFENDFGFKLSYTELSAINNATDEYALDRVGRTIIKNHFGDD